MLRFAAILRPLGERFLPSRRLGGALSGYVIREAAGPTIAALIGLTLLILTKDILSFMDFVINRGFGVLVVAMIAFYEIVPLASHTLPFAVLIGVLSGLGRLRVDNEIIALEAVGVAGWRLVGPVLAFATVMMTVNLLLSLFLAPWATRSLEATLRQMATENPGLSLRPGTVHEFQGIKLVAREVSARGDQLRGVLLWIPEHGQTLFAERGEITPTSEGDMQLILIDGVMLRTPRVMGEETRFTRFFQPLYSNVKKVRRNENFLAGVSFAELAVVAWGGGQAKDLARRAQIEFHRRFSYPIANLCFGLLAVPLALVGHRFSRAAGAVTGLLVTVLYYAFMQLGDGLIQGGVLHPGGGVWLPNLVVAGLSLVLLGWANWWSTWQVGFHRHRAAFSEIPKTPGLSPRGQRYVLQRYIVRQYLTMLALSFALLLTGYLLVDILERLQWFARYNADSLKAFQFYGARLPLLVSHIVPMALLLATALTVTTLSSRRELIGMRACGVAVARALLPVLLIAGLVTPAYFLLNELIVPKTNALADQIKNLEIKNRTSVPGPFSRMIWYQAGSRVYQAEQLDLRLGEAKEISIYNLGPDGLPVERIDASAARHVGQGLWELIDPHRIEISDTGFREAPPETRIQLGEAPTKTLDTRTLGVRDLARQIRETESNGYDATIYKVDFYVKLAAPLACLFLPAVALFFAIGGPPFPSPALTLLMSITVGISQILLTGVCAALGYGGFLPPFLAGWLPLLSVAALAGFFARRGCG